MAPEYMIVNTNIKNGYRVDFRQKRQILKSLFMVHNESLNIWTHLIGALAFVWIATYSYSYLQGFSEVGTLYHQHMMETFQNRWAASQSAFKADDVSQMKEGEHISTLIGQEISSLETEMVELQKIVDE
jgi:adiponectin receptor